jgi:hypothetical protein
MRHVHPNLTFAAMIVATAISSALGCQNQQNRIVANPFLAPDRVPPPATRALLPGQAQPYYPGDPLPVMQSSAQPASPAVVAAPSEPEMPSATQTLAWASPSGTPAATNAAFAAPSPAPATAPPQPTVAPAAATLASSEGAIAIPDDGSGLRFALPGQQPTAEPRPFIPNAPVAIASATAPVQPQPTPQLPAPPSERDARQTAYTEPVITQQSAPPQSPWQTPAIAQTVAPPSASNLYPQPVAAQPIGPPLALAAPPLMPYSGYPVAASSTMDVRLREVQSPAMPRIRIPGYESAAPLVGTADGFRPRTSMR